ncbi:NAD(+)/NADH kinase [Clostridium sp. SHJSY1]|uniref:NAD(+)/NADH kinase n=1 Tax=Clostridium sp. SHJSY1 TaxID=2942483 RepID=UPI0028761A52|nr:NAD(+)/NADH kinase [Clostridium sp. SHJSY1]MDS0527868.1 NAD(+)/NADH kinase [Clostridium sp. SHJSY1]
MKKIGIAINNTKDIDNKILNSIIEKFQNNFDLEEITVFSSFETDKQEFDSDMDLLVVLGGDGTLLNVAREICNKTIVPIFGINIGNLGFLSSIEISDIDEALKKIKEGKYKIDNRMLLHCRSDEDENKGIYNAFNDIVVARGTLSRMVKFQVFVDNKLYSTFKGDGLIVATPTGSTAYSFSAGGPFIYPNLDLITLTPICPHTKSMHTIVLSGNSSIEIIPENGEDEIYLTIDGQKATKIKEGTPIKVRRAKKHIKLLLFDDYDYFNMLRAKILNSSNE